MAIGAYGTTIPINIANVDIPNLVDISFVYHETRSYDSLSDGKFKHLDSSILTQAKREQEDDDVDEYIEGMTSSRFDRSCRPELTFSRFHLPRRRHRSGPPPRHPRRRRHPPRPRNKEQFRFFLVYLRYSGYRRSAG